MGKQIKTKWKLSYRRTTAGFSLAELIVSIALFSFVMLATATVLLSVVDADHKAQGLKTAIDNVSLSLESMSRNVRVGINYQCGGPGGGDCGENPRSILSFVGHDGVPVTYCLSAEAVRISKNFNPCDSNSSAITAPEISVNRLDFYVDGSAGGDKKQPRVFIVVGGFVNNATGKRERTKSAFVIQTLVSERLIDS